MSAIDQINANGQDYDIMSPEVVSDYVEKIGTICKNPNGYTKGSLFLARDAQDVERMYKTTANISGGQTITEGTNCTPKKLGDLFNDVDTEVGNVKQALSDEVVTRSELGAHNLLFYDMARIRNDFVNTGSWNGNVYTRSDVHYTFNSDGTISVSTESAGASADSQLNLMYFYDSSGNPKQKNQFLGKTITLTGCPSGGSVSSYYLRYVNATGDSAATDYGSGVTFTVGEYVSGRAQLVAIVIKSGTIITTPFVFKPMLRLATDSDTTYRPYVPTNAELLSYKDNGIVGSKNLLPDSKSCTSFVTSNSGATLVENADGSVTMANSDNSTRIMRRYWKHNLKPGTYILSTTTATNGKWAISIGPTINSTTGATEIGGVASGASEATFTLTQEQINANPYMILNQQIAANSSAITYYPMLRLATDTDPTYQPYAKTNRELTEVAQQVKGKYLFLDTDSVSVTADGVKTKAQLFYELITAFNSMINNNPDKYFKIKALRVVSSVFSPVNNNAIYNTFNDTTTPTTIYFNRFSLSTDGLAMIQATVSTTESNNKSLYMNTAGAITDQSSDVETSGNKYYLLFDPYIKVS